jgi:hypothetical protein
LHQFKALGSDGIIKELALICFLLTGSFEAINKALDHVLCQMKDKPKLNKIEVKWEDNFDYKGVSFYQKNDINVLRVGGNEIERIFDSFNDFITKFFENISYKNIDECKYDVFFSPNYLGKLNNFKSYIENLKTLLLPHKKGDDLTYCQIDKSFDNYKTHFLGEIEALIKNLEKMQENPKTSEEFFKVFYKLAFSTLVRNLNIIWDTCKNGYSNKELFVSTTIDENSNIFQYICHSTFKLWEVFIFIQFYIYYFFYF